MKNLSKIKKIKSKSYQPEGSSSCAIRMSDEAYVFCDWKDNQFTKGMDKSKEISFGLSEVLKNIVPPSVKKKNLGFEIGDTIKLKGMDPFTFRTVYEVEEKKMDGCHIHSVFYPSKVRIVEPGSNHYVLGSEPPCKLKNPFVRTEILCFYEDGKALVEYYTTRSWNRYLDIVDLSKYESCDAKFIVLDEGLTKEKFIKSLIHEKYKGLPLSFFNDERINENFVECLNKKGIKDNISFKSKFGFTTGEQIYAKSHEILLDYSIEDSYYDEQKLEKKLEKDIHGIVSFDLKSILDPKRYDMESINKWAVFGFVGDKVLVRAENKNRGFSREKGYQFELLDPKEIGKFKEIEKKVKSKFLIAK